jgi:hypothetical protein
MILGEYVKVRWNQNNKKYYIKKGYNLTKIGDLFDVKVGDLSNESHVLVNVKCDVCGKIKTIIYREYTNNIKNENYYCCSRKCCIGKKNKTVLKRYGVKNVSQREEIKEMKRQTNISNYGEIYMKYFPKYNVNSIIYLDILSEKLKLPILHALNGGEKKFIRYYVDGYIPEYNICIEWDERQHNVKRKIERDNKKDNLLKEVFGCQIVRINQKKFLNDIDCQTEIVVNKINEAIARHGK